MAGSFFSNLAQKFRQGDRPPFEKYYLIAFVLFLAYLAGDLGALYMRQHFIPTTIPNKKPPVVAQNRSRSYNFNEIITHNIFNSDRKIPPSLGEQEGGATGDEGAPRLSQLPLDLIGTIVHANPARSIATVMMRGQNNVEPYSVGQKIGTMAEVKEIRRERIIFRNLQQSVLEYIEIPQDAKYVISTKKNNAPAAAATKSPFKTNFTIQREEVEKSLENLSSLLQQARVVPELTADNTIKGFRMVEIQPGSLYEKLGLQLGDVLKGANGEDVTSPQKAMELFQSLRSSGTNEINLVIERDGQETTLNYKLQ